jgi:NTE family protein
MKHAEVKALNLALQGGGAHGAFTWGVLDRILEEDKLAIDGISATSAGAMNAALLVYGMEMGGKQEARKLLENFWKRISQAAAMTPLQPSIFDKMMGMRDFTLSPTFAAMEFMTRLFSPYQLNVFDINPFRDLLDEMIDYKALRQAKSIKLFVNATNVLTGKVRVFKGSEMTLDMLLASSCLPFLFKTVEIDGAPYWDGSYSGNPALFPLVYDCSSKDILIVQVNPIHVQQVPISAHDILDRVNEISFNTTLMREVRAIAFVSKLIQQGKVSEEEYRHIKVHVVEAEEIMAGLGHSSKFNADWEFLRHLKDVGRQAAEDWLHKHYDKIGRESSVDVQEYFL